MLLSIQMNSQQLSGSVKMQKAEELVSYISYLREGDKNYVECLFNFVAHLDTTEQS